jgi:hypothetical protein
MRYQLRAERNALVHCRDALLARYLQASGRRQEAVAVIRRVRIMQEEIDNACT